MKKQTNNNTPRNQWQKPTIKRISLDKNIQIVLTSPPTDPFEVPLPNPFDVSKGFNPLK